MQLFTKQPLLNRATQLVMALSLIAFAVGPSAALAEESQETSPAEEKKVKDRYFNGIFFGSLIFIHPERISIVVKPFQEQIGRKTFFLDKKTRYRVDGRKAKPDEVFEGDRVAIRYIAKNRFAVAEVIFVETGEFLPVKKYMAKIRARKKPKKKKSEEGADAAPEESSGGH